MSSNSSYLHRQGAAGALLDVYEQAIAELKKTIADIPDRCLIIITDHQTDDENCRSLQSILSHVVYAGMGYATSMHNHLSHEKISRPDKQLYTTTRDYLEALSNLFVYTEDIFKTIKDKDLEQLDNDLKIETGWKQLYDIEQLTEHAIVHILRHKRQIEKIKARLA